MQMLSRHLYLPFSNNQDWIEEHEVVGLWMITEGMGGTCDCPRRGNRVRRGPTSEFQNIRKFLTSESRLKGGEATVNEFTTIV